jgi:2-hydroxy-6-oxonona-2,4-dienedioate hydrolase
MHEKFVVVNGNKIRYLEEGNEEKIIVLLHGLGGMADRWLPLFPFLSKKYKIIAPDIIGYGKSDKPQVDYTIEFFTQFILEFLDTLSLQSIFMIGNSLGGQIAAECAATQSQLIKKTVLVTPSGIMKKSTPALDAYITAALYPTHESVKSAYEMMMGKNKQVREETIDNFISSMSRPNAKMVFISTLLGMKNAPTLTEKLQLIKIPTMLVWGTEDKLIPFEYAKQFAASMKNCYFVEMKNCGHTPFEEEPEKFSKLILDFLSK